MELKEILKLMEKKYPTNYREGMNPALFIYDDESGKIVKDASFSPYASRNFLFEFNKLDELIEHLQEGQS